MSASPANIISTAVNIISRLRLHYKLPFRSVTIGTLFPKSLNLHYEAAWTDSWSHRRCMHGHDDLIDAAKYAMPHGCGWYVIAVGREGQLRQLTDSEDQIVIEFRFGEKVGK